MLVGGLLEWVLGNSFPAVVFCSFGGFWFSYGATLIPSFAAYASYAPAGAESAAEGLSTTGFNASFGESKKRKRRHSESNWNANRVQVSGSSSWVF